MTRPRRIMYVAGTLGVGGAERQLLYMLRVLVGRGHRPEVIALEGGVYAERIRELGVPVTVLEPTGGPVRRLVQLTRLVARSRPDIIQASHNWVSAYVAILGRVLRRPAIGAMRSEPAETFGEVGRFGHLAFRLPRLIAANSTAAIEATTDFGIDRSRLVHLPNAIDTDRFRPVDGRHDGGPITIMAIGRLTRRKRFDLFLDIVADVAADQPDPGIRVLLVGDGPEKEALVEHAQRLGLGDRMTWRETDDPLESYRQADLLLFTSGPHEGMPNVVLEAMACGLAVIGFESGDVARVVIDGVSGEVIRPNGDTASMTAATSALLNDPDRLRDLGRSARQHVVENYSLDALGDNLERLHRRATTGSS